jgi:hypothetical protein
MFWRYMGMELAIIPRRLGSDASLFAVIANDLHFVTGLMKNL